MATVTSLGYLGIGVSDLAAWKTYANDVLGIEAIERGSRLDLRYDEQVWRLSCLLYTSPSPRDATLSRMPSSA